jgi:hypothetical protein
VITIILPEVNQMLDAGYSIFDARCSMLDNHTHTLVSLSHNQYRVSSIEHLLEKNYQTSPLVI